nr:hypothetical protein [Tanacetum cinerariifolium]
KVAIQIQSGRLRDEAQAENEEFLKILDENIQRIIKEQVKEHVKKILIEKMESNKSIDRSNEQRNLYKALVEAYESDKIILDTYGDTVTLKRSHDDADKDKEPPARSDRSASSRKYTTFVTKTKAADYGHIKWIEDLVPRTMWNQEQVSYDKHALWGISHWGRKHQQFYGFAVNRESARDVYSIRRIIAVIDLQIVEWNADKSDSRRMLCFQRLSKNVHKKHRHLTVCRRSSARCRKLPKEAQPYKAGYVPFLSEAQGSLHRLLQSMRIHLSE